MAKTSNAPNSSEDEVAVLENARLDIDSFAVELPQEPAAAAAVGNHRGVVGTIVFLKKSAMVWFGWGDLQKGAADASTSTAKNASVGSALGLSMGPLIVAAPRTKYQGAFSSSAEAPISKLIGGENEDDEMMARQMASRLSKRFGISVFVSCSFASNAPTMMAGEAFEEVMILHRAAALAEREIGKKLEVKLEGGK